MLLVGPLTLWRLRARAGAAEVLRPELGLSLSLDMSLSVDELAASVEALLADRTTLVATGAAARAAALAWTEEASTAALLLELSSVLCQTKVDS